MFESEYCEAAVEVLDVLNNVNKNDLKKIPLDFIQFLVDISSIEYTVNFDHTKKIEQLELSQKAKELLGYIYIKWWSNEDEKENYLLEIKQNKLEREKELSIKYDVNNIFKEKNKKDASDCKNAVYITEYKEPIINKILRKIKQFFKNII